MSPAFPRHRGAQGRAQPAHVGHDSGQDAHHQGRVQFSQYSAEAVCAFSHFAHEHVHHDDHDHRHKADRQNVRCVGRDPEDGFNLTLHAGLQLAGSCKGFLAGELLFPATGRFGLQHAQFPVEETQPPHQQHRSGQGNQDPHQEHGVVLSQHTFRCPGRRREHLRHPLDTVGVVQHQVFQHRAAICRVAAHPADVHHQIHITQQEGDTADGHQHLAVLPQCGKPDQQAGQDGNQADGQARDQQPDNDHPAVEDGGSPGLDSVKDTGRQDNQRVNAGFGNPHLRQFGAQQGPCFHRQRRQIGGVPAQEQYAQHKEEGHHQCTGCCEYNGHCHQHICHVHFHQDVDDLCFRIEEHPAHIDNQEKNQEEHSDGAAFLFLQRRLQVTRFHVRVSGQQLQPQQRHELLHSFSPPSSFSVSCRNSSSRLAPFSPERSSSRVPWARRLP